MMLLSLAATPYNRQVARLVLLASIADSIDPGALTFAINEGLIPVADRAAVRRLVARVASVRRAWSLVDPATRERLTTPRYAHRVKAACALVEASDGS